MIKLNMFEKEERRSHQKLELNLTKQNRLLFYRNKVNVLEIK